MHWNHVFDRNGSASFLNDIKSAGFNVFGAGKIFHKKNSAPKEIFDDYCALERAEKYPPLSKSVKNGDLGKGSDFGQDSSNLASDDDLSASWIIDKMQASHVRTAWCLGIFRPHLPFIAPPKYFADLPEVISLPPGIAGNSFDPASDTSHQNLPKEAQMLANRQKSMGEALVKNGEYAEFLRAYLASVAYADSILARVLAALEDRDLAKDTLVVVWSDHGWQLGEKLAFRKFTLWERALRVPIIFAGPGISPSKIDTPVSLVDVGPTILSLLGVSPHKKFSGEDGV